MIDQAGWIAGMNRYQAADQGGTLLHPSLIVIHYTAGVSFDSDLRTLTAESDPKVSAHFLVGPDGESAQLVSCKRIAHHAGQSSWQGRSGCNTFAIGVEVVNPGYARPGIKWAHTATVSAVHKHGGPRRDWYLYTDAQYQAIARIVREVWGMYGECAVVGHDDIAPGRKIDVGPAFSFQTLMDLCPPVP